MQFKYTILALIASFVNSEKCPALTDNCGDVSLPPNFNVNMTATLYSEANFKGDYYNIAVKGAYGCTNDLPPYAIKSFLSTASTKVTLHYGKDCVGHVIEELQGGTDNLDLKKGCPGSVFIKLQRYGSC